MSLTLETAFETPLGVSTERTSEFASAGAYPFQHRRFCHRRATQQPHGYRWKHQTARQHGSGLKKKGLGSTLSDGNKPRTFFCVDIDLDGGVPARIEDLTR